jgi:hypothetical protein
MAIPRGIAISEWRYHEVSPTLDGDAKRYRHLRMAIPRGIAILRW